MINKILYIYIYMSSSYDVSTIMKSPIGHTSLDCLDNLSSSSSSGSLASPDKIRKSYLKHKEPTKIYKGPKIILLDDSIKISEIIMQKYPYNNSKYFIICIILLIILLIIVIIYGIYKLIQLSKKKDDK